MSISVHSLRLWIVRKVTFVALELNFRQVHGKRFNFESNDSILISVGNVFIRLNVLSVRPVNLLAVHVIRENELQVVVDVRIVLVHHSESVAVLKLKLHCVWVDNPCGDWKIIDQQVHEVFMFDSLRHFLGLLDVPIHWQILGVAQQLAVDVLSHSYFVRSVHNSVT